MADYAAMGKRVTHHPLARVVAAAGLAGCVLVGSGRAFAGSGPSTTPATSSKPSATTTTSLPPIPKVNRSLTDGQNPTTLLANAIELSSVGIDSSALTTAIAATQAKLDVDASVASKAGAAADAANQRASDALATAYAAAAQYQSMDGAVKAAVIQLYMGGPSPLQVSPQAGSVALYAQAYASSTLTPYGILATQHEVANIRQQALAEATAAQKLANREQAKASKALTAERAAATRLEEELKAISAASATEVAADHVALAGQAGKELLAASALQFTPKTRVPSPVSTTPVALTWAFAELGKPYVWGATGPTSFDCSGLTQFVWRAAGVNIPRVAADQDAWSIPVPLSDLLPGDLVFYGQSYIHHVGIYIGDGLMINAPHTGTFVQVSSIWWSDLAGFGRVHATGTPVPTHQPPSAAQPAKPVVVATAGPVPSQTKPPKGWKPKPGSTTPIRLTVTPPTTAMPTTTTSSTTSTTSTSTTTTVPPSTTVPSTSSTT
jgi:cell wall-associated NlpC family hydrolase